MRRSTGFRAALAMAMSAQLLAAVSLVTTASAQPQQPQYGEGPGVVTGSLPATGGGPVQQPIYGEGPGVIAKGLPNTGSGPAEFSEPWAIAVAIAGLAFGVCSVLVARARKLARRRPALGRVMVVTPGS